MNNSMDKPAVNWCFVSLRQVFCRVLLLAYSTKFNALLLLNIDHLNFFRYCILTLEPQLFGMSNILPTAIW